MGRFATNPEVVCTVLEEGAVLLNMETRFYYSLNPVGLEIWQLITAGSDEAELAQRLTTSFDVDEQQAQKAISSFLGELERERLLIPDGGARESSASGEASAAVAEGDGRRLPFTEPELIRHDEPLHEISTSPFDPQLPLAE